MALDDIDLRFAWHAWRLWHCAGSGGALGPVLVAGDAAALCVAGVALGDIHLRFAWQAWHLMTSAFVLRGRRGTYGTGLALVSHAIFVTHHLSHTPLSHTIFHTPSLTHPLSKLFHTHYLCHTTSFTHYLSHTLFHTQLCHTPSLTHHLSHTTLTPTIFDTPSFTHNFMSQHLSPHHLSHTAFTHIIFRTQLCHSHTIFLCHSPSFTYNFVTRNFVLLLDPPPPPLSFLSSSSPLQYLVLIIGRSCHHLVIRSFNFIGIIRFTTHDRGLSSSPSRATSRGEDR